MPIHNENNIKKEFIYIYIRISEPLCSVSVGVSGFWYTQSLFESSKHLWRVRGLILNAIFPSYCLARASTLPLDMGYLFLVGSNILQFNGCSAANCSFGVLTEDEHMSLYSTIIQLLLTKAGDSKKRWQEYRERYKKR